MRMTPLEQSTIQLSKSWGATTNQRPLPPLQVYRPLNTFVALIGLEVWTDADKISVRPPAGATLDAFTSWRNKMVKSKPNDNSHLLT